jgi:hypothetical protein
VDATVTQTDCARGQVQVTTKLFALEHAVTDIPAQQCLLLNPGNFVEYHLRTEHTRVFEFEGGNCLYDSVTVVC